MSCWTNLPPQCKTRQKVLFVCLLFCFCFYLFSPSFPAWGRRTQLLLWEGSSLEELNKQILFSSCRHPNALSSTTCSQDLKSSPCTMHPVRRSSRREHATWPTAPLSPWQGQGQHRTVDVSTQVQAVPIWQAMGQNCWQLCQEVLRSQS